MDRTPLDRWIRGKIAGRRGESNLSQIDLNRYRIEKLRSTIDDARSKSAFYANALRNLPGSCLSEVDDIRKFPFTTAEHIQNHCAEFLCVSQSQVRRVVTLGVTGSDIKTRRIYFTAEDLEATTDFFHHGMSTLVEPGQRVLIMMPGERPDSIGELLVNALRRLGAEGIAYGLVRDPAHAIHEIERLKIDTLVAIPVQVLALARFEESRLIAHGRIKTVLLSTDYVSSTVIEAIESAWSCKVFSHYGSTEMGYGGGVECEAFHGYHLREADLYFEIVDPESGETRKTGETGEIVFTTLSRKGMPFIRYRTGDLSRFLPDPCPCGSFLRRLDRVRGRINDFVRLGENHWLGTPDLDDTLFKVPGLRNYTATLNHRDHRDQLDIVVDTAGKNDESIQHEVRRLLAEITVLKNAIDDCSVSIGSVTFGVVAETETSASKRYVRDQRRKTKKPEPITFKICDT